ncbi:MAG: phage holin family protein [Muribaculaceae bacterium]|nr:phage holin family protein [Muribaculaceae bacterium]MBQ6648682.1 phage holin family protein [Muribaculaceae bacterium]
MNTENLRRLFFTAMGAVGTALAPTLPYILLCTAAVLGDCLSAYLLARRVKKAYPDEADRETGKFKSYHFGKTLWTLLCVYALLIFAHFLELYVTESLPFNALKVAAGAVIFWQGWSILENCSSCNGAKWAQLLQKIMVDKTERHLDIDLSDLKQHGADGNDMAGNRSASPAGVINTFIGDNKPSGVVPEPGSLMLRLERTALKAKYTIGHLYVMQEGKKVYVCDTIEDTVRDVNKNGRFDPPNEVKIKTLTAIPYGRYEVSMRTKSPKFSNYSKYPYAKKYNGYMPRLLNVNHFEGILIHPGSSEKSSAGCIIVGYNKVVGRVVDSQQAFYHLMDNYLWPARKRGQKIYITIV